ncbi:XRE family transcriptional regulator [Microlunatus parietis]|uniref:Transcriptional regulator with XRE-family HTH domain n=1 Tax=Microlunatus parietis TaxID=682979 RepID=A0A7Y9LCG2_9ACTN|nr:XRE family transcriptional regulator [Microlunatus parietis]NYE70876.1 transcriptional regulator with XRE-family HTH domain [Microlunatus parietis]
MAEKKRARRWEDVRSEKHALGTTDEVRVTRYRREMRQAQRAYKLAEIRKAHVPRQADVAAAMGVSAAAVSKLENGDLSRTQVGTLESYVAALGGRLRVVAEFPDETITIED